MTGPQLEVSSMSFVDHLKEHGLWNMESNVIYHLGHSQLSTKKLSSPISPRVERARNGEVIGDVGLGRNGAGWWRMDQ